MKRKVLAFGAFLLLILTYHSSPALSQERQQDKAWQETSPIVHSQPFVALDLASSATPQRVAIHTIQIPKLPPSPALQIPQPKPLPDLIITSLQWSNPLKKGGNAGPPNVLSIIVKNQGSALAGPCQARITCMASGTVCPSELSGLAPCMPLAAGASTSISWPNVRNNTWSAGEYRITAEIDAQKEVSESDEQNNSMTLEFVVAAIPPLIGIPAASMQASE